MIWLLVGIVWAACALTVTGWMYADMRAEFPKEDTKRSDLGMSVLWGLLLGFFGPIGVLFVWLTTGFAQHGWSLPSTFEKRSKE